jgi:hypothetical protein
MMTDILRAVQSEMDKRAGIVDVRVDVATPMTGPQEKQLDRRTKEGQEQEIFQKIRADKGVSAGWLQEKAYRERTLQRLLDNGRIKNRTSAKTAKDPGYRGFSIVGE